MIPPPPFILPRHPPPKKKKIVLAILVPLPFHVSFRVMLSMSTKNLLGFDMSCVNPVYQFGENGHLSTLC